MGLLPHQVEGVKWLAAHEIASRPRGGLLCDEMGLGKTIQMIALMRTLNLPKTLVVVPKSIVKQWNSELEQFGSPDWTLCIFDGPKRKYNPSAHVVVCPYSVVADLLDHEWDRVILDEAQEIRNRKSLVHKTCLQLKAERRWCLTGTPVFNRFRDFVALCEFVGIPKSVVARNEREVRDKFVLRRTATCSTGKLVFQNIELEMYPDELDVYDEVYGDGPGERNVLEWILRCRQVCAWPGCYSELNWTPERPTAKMDTLAAMIKRHPTERSIIFTQFIEESNEIRRRLEAIGRSVFLLNGHTSEVDQFKACTSDSSDLVIQIKAGGVGLNLQEATRVYIMQPSWNPATELQAIARSYRNGQTKDVHVKKLVYSDSHTVDNELVGLQRKKSKLCAQVLQDDDLIHKIPEVKKTASNFLISLGNEIQV